MTNGTQLIQLVAKVTEIYKMVHFFDNYFKEIYVKVLRFQKIIFYLYYNYTFYLYVIISYVKLLKREAI